MAILWVVGWLGDPSGLEWERLGGNRGWNTSKPACLAGWGWVINQACLLLSASTGLSVCTGTLCTTLNPAPMDDLSSWPLNEHEYYLYLFLDVNNRCSYLSLITRTTVQRFFLSTLAQSYFPRYPRVTVLFVISVAKSDRALQKERTKVEMRRSGIEGQRSIRNIDLELL